MLEFKNKNIWIYGFGSAGKWVSDNTTSNIKGFIDSGSAKHKLRYNNFDVISPDQAKTLVQSNDLIIVTVLDIHDIIPVLNEKFADIDWIAVGSELNSQAPKNNKTGDTDNFVEYTLKAVEICHKNYLTNNKKFLHSVDIVISEKCSLNCKDCSNLMQYYKNAQNINYEMIVDDFEKLTQKMDHIFEVRLIGGEPFMNKDIYKIIDYFIDNKKITNLVVYTNATIPLKAELMKKFSTPKLVFSITDYGNLSKNTQKVIDILIEEKIPHRSMPPNNWTDSAVIKDQKRSEEGMIDIFKKCCGKNLFTIMYGKLYRCPFVSNAERLHAIPYNKNNGVSLDASLEEIINYTSDIKYIPACNFCNGRSHDAPEIIPAIQAKGKLPYKKYY